MGNKTLVKLAIFIVSCWPLQILRHTVVKGSLQQFPYSALHKMESSSTVTVHDYLKAARGDLVETQQAKSNF